jgi:hypothetical protein
MKGICCGALATLLIPGAYAALPGDVTEGQRLHQANCTGCHDSSVYTRPGRKIRSLGALEYQVEGCGHAAKKEFSLPASSGMARASFRKLTSHAILEQNRQTDEFLPKNTFRPRAATIRFTGIS